ncbi:MAG: acyl carrier protein [Oscillospiraceae bacterium]|nr:acyl carrier protein [Oscillospiraceae bacterium]
MTQKEIFDAVQEIFRDIFDDEELVITRDTTADDIEDWDSLEQINLLTAVGRRFGLKFKLEDVSGLENVGAMLDLVERMLKS